MGILRIDEKPDIGKIAGMSDPKDVYHETVHFAGRVQGVGFRYQALALARGFDVAGFVQNLPDGRVCLEVEGEAAEVAGFVGAIEEEMRGYVSQVERTGGRRARQFHGFTIR
jgi:acylphosphatase